MNSDRYNPLLGVISLGETVPAAALEGASQMVGDTLQGQGYRHFSMNRTTDRQAGMDNLADRPADYCMHQVQLGKDKEMLGCGLHSARGGYTKPPSTH